MGGAHLSLKTLDFFSSKEREMKLFRTDETISGHQSCYVSEIFQNLNAPSHQITDFHLQSYLCLYCFSLSSILYLNLNMHEIRPNEFILKRHSFQFEIDYPNRVTIGDVCWFCALKPLILPSYFRTLEVQRWKYKDAFLKQRRTKQSEQTPLKTDTINVRLDYHSTFKIGLPLIFAFRSGRSDPRLNRNTKPYQLLLFQHLKFNISLARARNNYGPEPGRVTQV